MSFRTTPEPKGLLLAALVATLTCTAPGAESPESATLETGFFRFTLSPETGACELLDKAAQVHWRSDPNRPRLGWVKLNYRDQSRQIDLTRCTVRSSATEIMASFAPFPEAPLVRFHVWARALPDQRTLEFSYQEDREFEIQSVSLLRETLAVTDIDHGYALVPVREGLLVPADSGISFTRRFDTYAYEGCHMAMLGLVKQEAAALLTWNDPYVAAELQSEVNPKAAAEARQRLLPSLVLTRSARSFRLQLLGKGDYVTVAKAYRQVAETNGWAVTWSEKLKDHPDRAKLFGAANFKLWSALDRSMNEDSTKENSVRVNWTFAEAAAVAEHLKSDLHIDQVLFTIGGWIHRGYDNQHPDILPTAPECGGDAAFADCARRILNLGYLLCLHDNYQDIYRDSPSWNEKYITKTQDGKLAAGGHWAGGRAYLTCSQMALELAKRPQNLAAVEKLSHANAYFIDTTYAAGLQECFDPSHPLTRSDDMKWKQALSDYAREVFGVFGSECGREWAIPHSDFFEGLTGVSGTYYHDAKLPATMGAIVVPLFDLVYRDCITMYGKYGYDPRAAAEYVLFHISLGRPLNYHSIPPHQYWESPPEAEAQLGLQPEVAELSQTGPRQFRVSYRWRTEKPSTGDWRAFVHFTDAAGAIKFQNDHELRPPLQEWGVGEVLQGPFTVSVPAGLTGTFNIRIGLFRPATGERALLRGREHGERSYLVGKLLVTTNQVSFQPVTDTPPSVPAGDPALFTRGDNGWAAGLHPLDRFLKNTCEILGPLNELTARGPMSSHRFLTPDRKVQQTTFGIDPQQAVVVTVNLGATNYSCSTRQGGEVLLPPYGFVVDSPTFVAFHALRWGGLTYRSPTIFTVRSLNQEPIRRSSQIRAYHACGEDQIQLAGTVYSVRREITLDPTVAGKGRRGG
jgi:hypothetical protein